MNLAQEYKPTDIRAERFNVIGKLQSAQLNVYTEIMNRSARGEWTSYSDLKDIGLPRGSIKKRVAELIQVHGVAIHKRTRSGREIEFCV